MVLSVGKKILWITQTAMMLALLVALQGITAGLGNQLLTGSCVNLVLVAAALLVGTWGGAVVALISPFMAFLLQIGPKYIQLIPAIAVGNLVLVLIYSLILGQNKQPVWKQAVALAGAAAAKFVALYLLAVQLVIPGMVSGGVVQAAAAGKLGATFGVTQLITAIIGGAVALAVVPLVRKALRKGG
jgi:hypothetical protein